MGHALGETAEDCQCEIVHLSVWIIIIVSEQESYSKGKDLDLIRLGAVYVQVTGNQKVNETLPGESQQSLDFAVSSAVVQRGPGALLSPYPTPNRSISVPNRPR